MTKADVASEIADLAMAIGKQFHNEGCDPNCPSEIVAIAFAQFASDLKGLSNSYLSKELHERAIAA